MSLIRVGDIDVNYQIDGAGTGKPWITLSHSLCCHLGMWDELAAVLAPHYQVLRYDTRGHGATSAPAGDYSFGQLTADLRGLLDALGIERSDFLGLSMGGMIGQHLALLAPARLGKLVVTCSSSRIPAEAGPLWDERIRTVRAEGTAAVVEATLGRWFTPAFRAAQPDAVARIGAMIAATPVAGYAGCGAAIRNLDITARLAAVTAPTLVIAGREDPGTPPAMNQAIAAAIPGARYAELPGSHLCCLENEADFHRLVLTFLIGE